MSKWKEYGPPRMGEPEPLSWKEVLEQRNEALDLLEQYFHSMPPGESIEDWKDAVRAILNHLRVEEPLTQFQQKAMREVVEEKVSWGRYDHALRAMADAIDDLRKEIK